MSANTRIDRRRVRELYKAGYSVSEIITEIEMGSIPYVRELLKSMGFDVKTTDCIDIPKVKALQQAGWNMDQIVDEFGFNFTAEEIKAALKAAANRKKVSKKKEEEEEDPWEDFPERISSKAKRGKRPAKKGLPA